MTRTLIGAGRNDTAPARRVVAGRGSELRFEDGSVLLDASNTGAPLGHGHPLMVAAMHAAAQLPVVNEGNAWADRDAAADEFVAAAFGDADWVGGVRFCMSGSEANDLALSLAQVLTGRRPLVARERAYHGFVGLAREVTVQPQWHGGLTSTTGVLRAPSCTEVRVIGAPDGCAWYRDRTADPIPPAADLDTSLAGAAAVIVDYTQGGRYWDPDYQTAVVTAARRHEALWIADEVVTGLGRSGRRTLFSAGPELPDVVTFGKPLGGGSAAAAAVVVSQRVRDVIDTGKWQNYSTFRGHPGTVAAIRAYLRALREEDLCGRAVAQGARLGSGLRELAAAHPSIDRVAGQGLHWTVELAGGDWRTWFGEDAAPQPSTVVVAAARDAGVQIGTSDEAHSIFIAPPLIVTDAEVDRILAALDRGFTALQQSGMG